MRFIIPIILIGIAGSFFFVFTNPIYNDVSALNRDVVSYNGALDNSKMFENERDKLTFKYNLINSDNLIKLKKLLPDNVDNIKLVLEINRVAEQYNLQVKNIKYDIAKKEVPTGNKFVAQAPTGPAKDYAEFDLEFSLQGSYGNFVSFLESLEKSLRIVDMQSIAFSSSEAVSQTGAPTDNYKYDLKIKTYWLKGTK